jgi:hypothetical protein
MSNEIINASDVSNVTDTTELSLDELALVQGGWNPFKAVGNLIEDAGEAVVDFVEDAGEAVVDFVEGAGEAIVDAAEATGEAFADAGEWTWNAVNSDEFKKVTATVGAIFTAITLGEKAYDYFHEDEATEEALRSIEDENFYA